jgi:hypothetical protein
VHPVDRLVEVEGVPSQLVGDVVDLLVGLVLGVRVVGGGFSGLEVAVAARGQDAVQPCLLVLMARRCEGSPGELLGVEAVWGLLGGVCADGQRAFYGFRSGGQVSMEKRRKGGGATHSW